jgi:hypothetical protein
MTPKFDLWTEAGGLAELERRTMKLDTITIHFTPPGPGSTWMEMRGVAEFATVDGVLCVRAVGTPTPQWDYFFGQWVVAYWGDGLRNLPAPQ